MGCLFLRQTQQLMMQSLQWSIITIFNDIPVNDHVGVLPTIDTVVLTTTGATANLNQDLLS